MANELKEGTLYDRVVQHIFYSGQMGPSSKIVEKRLADHLGVSRIPIRETLGKLAGQGLLVGEANGQGVRVRQYTAEEVRQLYELRELLEGGAARAAARSATDLDIARMKIICDQSDELEPHEFSSRKWFDLDHTFHATLADASHNDRIARLLKLLLTECHYVFYQLPQLVHARPTPAELRSHTQAVLQDHRTLLQLVRDGKADEAENKARADMRASSSRATQAMLASDLRK